MRDLSPIQDNISEIILASLLPSFYSFAELHKKYAPLSIVHGLIPHHYRTQLFLLLNSTSLLETTSSEHIASINNSSQSVDNRF